MRCLCGKAGGEGGGVDDVAGARRACSRSSLTIVPTTDAHHAPARALAGVSTFTHPSFAPRTLKQQTVCIVCQRWFCNIKNSDRKSRFYNTFEKPECYFLWLGDRADTPEAQAEFLAAPYKGEGGLTVGWRNPKYAKCNRCSNAAMTAEAQENTIKAIKNRPKEEKKLHMRKLRAGRKEALGAAAAVAPS